MLFLSKHEHFVGQADLMTSVYLNQEIVFFTGTQFCELMYHITHRISCPLGISAFYNEHWVGFMLIKDQYLEYALTVIFHVSIEKDNVVYCIPTNGFTGCLEVLICETPGNSDTSTYEER